MTRKSFQCVILAGILLVTSGCGVQKSKAPKLQKQKVATQKEYQVKKKDIYDIEMVYGEVTGIRECAQASIAGTIDTQNKKMGDKVKKGEVICTLDTQEWQEEKNYLMQELATEKERYQHEKNKNELQKKQKEVTISAYQQQAKKKRKNAENIKKQCLIAKEEITQLEHEQQYADEKHALVVKEKEDQITALQDKMDKAKICAPCNGILVTYLDDVAAGSDVEKQKPVAVILNEDKKVVQLQEKLSNDDNCKCYIGEQQYEAKAYEYSNKQMLAYNQVKMKAFTCYTFEEIEQYAIGDAVVAVSKMNQADGVLAIPNDAVKLEQQELFVYVKRDGKKVKQTVETGIKTENETEIVSGLKEGDVIVYQAYDGASAKQVIENAQKRVKDAKEQKEEIKKGDLYYECETYLDKAELIYDSSKVKCPVEGVIASYQVETGDSVKAGQVIAYVESANAKSELLAARQELEQAQKAQQTAGQTYQTQMAQLAKQKAKAKNKWKKLEIQYDMDIAKEEYALQKAENKVVIDTARQAYEDLAGKTGKIAVVANRDGQITEMTKKKKGELLTMGEEVTQIKSEKAKYLMFRTNCAYTGMDVEITTNNSKEQDYVVKGKVVSASANIYGEKDQTKKSENEQNAVVEAIYIKLEKEIDEAVTYLKLNVKEKAVENVPVITSDALYSSSITYRMDADCNESYDSNSYVITKENGTYKKQVVKAMSDNNHAWILEGASIGDMVVYTDKELTEEELRKQRFQQAQEEALEQNRENQEEADD